MKSALVDQLGAALGPAYTIERELEGGGMARVFVAFDDTLQRRVAVKVLPEHMAAAVSVDRFRREILLSAGLQHPHIVGVLSAGIADGLPYFVMPYVDGESLGTRLLTHGRLTVPQAVSIMKDVARALAYAHERGVVHRDIKPHNILLASGAATVTDFGVAKALSSAQRISGDGRSTTLTDAGTSLGTPLYMAPEQAAADPDIDHRADIYAFGVTAYEMLVGEPPFAGLGPRALMTARMTEDPPHVCSVRPDVPKVLADLVMRCLERDPADRPQTAYEVLVALDDPAMVSGAFGTATTGAGRWRRARDWRVVAGALVALGVLGAGLFAAARRDVEVRPAPPTLAAVPAAAAVSRVVVLPLVSIGGDSANAYLADGVTNELASALSRVPGVQVVSPSRAAALLASGRSPSDVGRELGVTRQLEGTVQREGKRLRVTARLVDVRDGTMTWSDTYERDVTDLLSVQKELTRVITGAVREAIGAQTQPADTAPPPVLASMSSEAYDLYLRGRFQLNKRGAGALRQAITYFQQAIAKDRDLAPAYSGLAAAQGMLPLHANVDVARSLADGIRNADRAIALDSNLADAWAARGVLHARSWQWAESERDLRRAIAIDPKNAAAEQWLGELLSIRGRAPEAVAALQRASQLDAGSPVIVGSLAIAQALSGRVPEALVTAERAVSYDSSQIVTRIMLGGVRLYAHRPAQAIAPLEAALQLDPSSTTALGLLGYAYGALGDVDAAHRTSARVEALAAAPGKEVALGRIALALGDTGQAVARLERAAKAKDPFFSTESARSPIFAPLQANARYQALLRSVGL